MSQDSIQNIEVFSELELPEELPPILSQLGRYEVETEEEDAEGGAEISAFDPESDRLFVVNALTNSIDILDLSNLSEPTLISSIDLNEIAAGVNSVAVNEGIVAVALANDPEQDPGAVAFFDTEGALLNRITGLGALPDMLTFTPDGTKVIVAN